MHSIWMPWFHLCWRGPCTQLYPSCWKAQQSSQARLLKRTELKAFLLTCQCLHFLQQKPIHHVQKLDTLSVWHGNDPQFHIQRRLCTFPRIGRSVYIKHSCEMLWSLISVLTALLSAITGMGMQKVNADAFLGLIRGFEWATKQLAGAVSLAWSRFTLLPQPSRWRQYWRADEALLQQLQAHHCWAGTFRLLFWLKWGLQ